MIILAIGNTLAPLSSQLIAKEISTVFKPPVTRNDRYLNAMASLIEKTSTHIVLQAEVRNKKENWQPEGQSKLRFYRKKEAAGVTGLVIKLKLVEQAVIKA
jgi:hypothetical protein